MKVDQRSPESRLVEVASGDLKNTEVARLAAYAAFDAVTCIRAAVALQASEVAPPKSGPVTAIGQGTQGPLFETVAWNAQAAHALDRDDVHWPTATHSGGIVWPTAFGVGEAEGRTVGEVLRAGALGYQVGARAARLLGPAHRSKFHATTTCGSLAAAAVAASLGGATVDEQAAAVCSAASVMGGTRQALFELTSTMATHRAFAATAGLVAARLGSSNSVSAPLSGSVGFASATGITLDVQSLTSPMAPVVEELIVRTHPATGFAPTMIDAILSLPPVQPDLVRSVRVTLAPTMFAAHHAGAPQTRTIAGWNFQWVAALALTRRLGVRQIAWPLPSDLQTLVERVVIRSDDSLGPQDMTARVEIHLDDGVIRSSTCKVPNGHPGSPLTVADLRRRSVDMGAFADDAAAGLVLDLLQEDALPVSDVLAAVVDTPKTT